MTALLTVAGILFAVATLVYAVVDHDARRERRRAQKKREG